MTTTPHPPTTPKARKPRVAKASKSSSSDPGTVCSELTVPRARARETTVDGEKWVQNEDRLPSDHKDIEWPDGFKPWQVKFLNALAFRPVVVFACKSANVSSVIAYRVRKESETFAECWDQAEKLGWDRVEEAAHVRAVDGVERAIFDRNGKVIGTEVKYSDGLAELLLKGNRPEKYREKQPGALVPFQSTEDAIAKALGRGLLAGIGAKLAERLENTAENEAVEAETR